MPQGQRQKIKSLAGFVENVSAPPFFFWFNFFVLINRCIADLTKISVVYLVMLHLHSMLHLQVRYTYGLSLMI